jgi:hypothetical protein
MDTYPGDEQIAEVEGRPAESHKDIIVSRLWDGGRGLEHKGFKLLAFALDNPLLLSFWNRHVDRTAKKGLLN